MIETPILCKSALSKDQLTSRRLLDIDGIELQLLGDFVDDPLSTKDYISILGEDVGNIKVIHVPLRSGEEIVCIQYLAEYKYQEIFERVCSLAEEVSVINKSNVLVVIHNDLNLEDYVNEDTKYLKILNYLKTLLKKYPNIRIGIENVIPYKPPLSSFSNGCLPIYTEFIRDLRLKLNTDRIGSVLDTCHAMTTIKVMNFLNEHISRDISIDIEDFYKSNEDICFLVHLCNVEDLGFNKMEHGTGFTEDDIRLLSTLMNFHRRYIKDAIITLEVAENDYTNCLVYSKSKKILDWVINLEIAKNL